MVRVPGIFGASEFHREATDEDVKIKLEPGTEALAAEGSSPTREKTRFLDRGSFGRSSYDKKIKEEDQATDLKKTSIPSPGPFRDPCRSSCKA